MRIDATELRSSMTLLRSRRAAPDEPVFRKVLDEYFKREPDRKTTTLL